MWTLVVTANLIMVFGIDSFLLYNLYIESEPDSLFHCPIYTSEGSPFLTMVTHFRKLMTVLRQTFLFVDSFSRY